MEHHLHSPLRTAAALVALAVSSACLHPPAAPPAAAVAAAPSNPAIRAAGDELQAYVLAHNLGLRLLHGLPADELPDLSLEGARRDAAFGAKLLAELAALQESGLSGDDADSLGALRYSARTLADGERFYWLQVPITPYASPQRDVLQALAQHPFAGEEDARHYLQLLERYGRWIRGIEDLLREQARRGIVLEAAEIPASVAPFKSLLEQEPGPFRVAPERLAALPQELRRSLPSAIEQTVARQVAPPLRHLASFLEGEYTRAAPGEVGLSQYPGGNAYYRWLVRRETTLDLAPEEIHAIGKAEIERIEREMERIRIQLRFGSLAELRQHLRSDPRFFVKTPEEVGAKLLAAQERLAPKLDRFFGHAPRASYGIERLNPALEGAIAFGYYDSPHPGQPRGIYFYNGSKLDQRSTLMAAALIYHELAPGHHFQIALQHENEALPPFRRDTLHTAFTEGWGEYASDLAGEAGMYDDPYDRLGRLMMDSFLSSRLVVDTGMNALGWSRQVAIDYMAAHTLQSPEEIATETLRYCCDMPAQALAYKLGSRTVHQLRDRAARQLGDAFDLRRFHDAVLSGGSLPLPVLERRIDRFIAAEKTKGAAPSREGTAPR